MSRTAPVLCVTSMNARASARTRTQTCRLCLRGGFHTSEPFASLATTPVRHVDLDIENGYHKITTTIVRDGMANNTNMATDSNSITSSDHDRDRDRVSHLLSSHRSALMYARVVPDLCSPSGGKPAAETESPLHDARTDAALRAVAEQVVGSFFVVEEEGGSTPPSSWNPKDVSTDTLAFHRRDAELSDVLEDAVEAQRYATEGAALLHAHARIAADIEHKLRSEIVLGRIAQKARTRMPLTDTESHVLLAQHAVADAEAKADAALLVFLKFGDNVHIHVHGRHGGGGCEGEVGAESRLAVPPQRSRFSSNSSFFSEPRRIIKRRRFDV